MVGQMQVSGIRQQTGLAPPPLSGVFGRLSTTRSRSTSLQLVKRDLMTADEVMRMGADRMLLLRTGHAPLVGRKARYFADAELAGRFDA